MINRNHHGGEKCVHQGRTTGSSDQGLIHTLDDQWFNLLPWYYHFMCTTRAD